MSEVATEAEAPTGVLGKIAAAVSSFLISVKHDALEKVTGLANAAEGAVADLVTTELEKLVHAVAALPAGSTIEKLAEGFMVKIVGNGLPRHGFGATLAAAIEDALGVPSHVSHPPVPTKEPAPEQPEAADPAPIAAPSGAAPTATSGESTVAKLETVAVNAGVAAVEKIAEGESVVAAVKETAVAEASTLVAELESKLEK